MGGEVIGDDDTSIVTYGFLLCVLVGGPPMVPRRPFRVPISFLITPLVAPTEFAGGFFGFAICLLSHSELVKNATFAPESRQPSRPSAPDRAETVWTPLWLRDYRLAMPRNTTSGRYYEETIQRAIERSCNQCGLTAKSQQIIGKSPSGRRHKVDWELVSNSDSSIRGLVSCKFQDVGGTAEEKVPYEVLKLLHAMETDGRYRKSWIVLGGTGWTAGLKSFYTTTLQMWIPAMSGRVVIIPDTDTMLSTNLSLA